ncbi:MAG TPA: glycoside hydrolase family 30 beta sandwich domain-containing protein [Puia sp.]|jgi:glucosylceramidase
MLLVTRRTLLGATFCCVLGSNVFAQKAKPVEVWLTDPVHNVFFTKQPPALFFEKGSTPQGPVIKVDDSHGLQQMDGFGFALTGGSAQHIIQMSPGARKALLQELFRTDSNFIGTSYLRVSIGASDLSDHVFSYDDLPAGQTDTDMTHFDLGPDLKDVVPVLKEIIEINPQIRILGSSWSPPVWMKTNHDTRGGSLLPQYYSAFANYLVKYILAMQDQGIGIEAITVQNEPLHPGNNPSMLMPADEEAAFIKKALGPAFQKARLDTKIIIYDHNADRPDYPISILKDPDAAQYIDGSAFHLYAGKIDTLSSVHEAFPDKNLYFTEQWVGAPGDFKKDIPEHIQKLIVGASRNWCKTVIEWNLAANSKWEPHTDRGGCDRCLGAVTIDGDKVGRNPAYYIIAHAAKFVRPGSIRVATNSDDTLPNVAFLTPGHQLVVIVLNNTESPQTFCIEYKGQRIRPSLAEKAVATYVVDLK